MSIRVGLRPMGRALGLVAPPAPPVFPMEYVFAVGTNVMYDTVHPVPSTSVTAASGTAANPTKLSGQRKKVRLSDETLFIIYPKSFELYDRIFVKESADDGSTWINETRIAEGYEQIYPAIAVDSNDHLHAVWTGKGTGHTTNRNIWYAEYTDSWQDPVYISTYAGMSGKNQGSPAIVIDSNDNIHVLWSGEAPAYGVYDQIWYALYDGSWHTPVRISTVAGMNTEEMSAASIAVDSSDYLHTVWQGKTNGYNKYQLWYSLYNGSWQNPVRISTHTGMQNYHQTAPSIAVDYSDHIHVVWKFHETNIQIWYAEYTDSWQDPVKISTAEGMDTYPQEAPSIAVDDGDNIHVLWDGKATGYTDNEKIWYAKYTDSWATPECIQPTGKNVDPNLRWSRWP